MISIHVITHPKKDDFSNRQYTNAIISNTISAEDICICALPEEKKHYI